MSEQLEMRDVEAFVSVAEMGSFTAAAQALLLSQPTVSARLSALETVLDTRLFDRIPGGVRLTPAGEVFLPLAKALLRQREDAVDAVRAFLGKPGGTLLVGASSIPGTYILPPILGRLRALHPGIRIRLEIQDSERALAALDREEVEVAVVGKEPDSDRHEASPAGHDEIVLVAAPGLAAPFLDPGKAGPRGGKRKGPPLEEIPLVLREPGSGTRAAALAAVEKAGVLPERLKIVLEVGGNAAAREAALAGLGAAFLSRLAVEDLLRAGKLVEIPCAGSPIRRPFFVATRSGRTLSPGASALVRLLLDRGAEAGRPGEARGTAQKRRSRSNDPR